MIDSQKWSIPLTPRFRFPTVERPVCWRNGFSAVWRCVLFIFLLAVCQPLESDGGNASPSIWYGPLTLDYATRSLRKDFLRTFTDTQNWPTVYKRTAVFKQFIETLSPTPCPATGRPLYTDEELRQLAAFVNKAGLKTDFEIGGLRWTKDSCGPGSGRRSAAKEIKTLQRWVDAGGKIDYLTTDHAVMWNVGLVLQGNKELAGLADPDWHKVLDEVADSLAMIHKAFPEAKIGMIESLGYFSVRGANGEMYPTTDPACIYPIDFGEFLVTVRKKLQERGIALDHWHLDFGYRDCFYDGRNTKTADFNRLIGAERQLKSLGIPGGIIINAFDDFSQSGTNLIQEKEKARNVAERNDSAVRNTLAYLEAYRKAGGNPDTWIFQRWQPYPDTTGPETVPGTDMGLTRALLDKLNN